VGLRPIEGTVHYPVIRIEKVPVLPWVQGLKNSSHILFTSQTAVELFKELVGSPPDLAGIAVGKKTFSLAQSLGFSMQYVAIEETQEGLVPILENLDIEMLFWPRSVKARGIIRKCCKIFDLPLYDVLPQEVDPKPCLEDFDEVLLTSPSTVEAFFDLYTSIPKGLKFRSIGPITALALQRRIG
jgi:uroporphyrinogen-III synthase